MFFYPHDIMVYYVIVSLISFGLVMASYFLPNMATMYGFSINSWFAQIGLMLLWITLFVKPLFMILVRYTELRTITLRWLRQYLKTIKGRDLKWLGKMLVSVIYFFAALGMRFRRQLGITTFLAIFTHAGLVVVNRIHMHLPLIVWFQTFRMMMWGLWFLMLLIGYLTSNDVSVRTLKSNRKTIQYASYVALIAGLIHASLYNPEFFSQFIILAIYIVLKLIERQKIKTFTWPTA